MVLEGKYNVSRLRAARGYRRPCRTVENEPHGNVEHKYP